MRLVVFSDPHIDINEKRKDQHFTEILLNFISNLNPDVVLLTGDIAGQNKYLEKFFRKSTSSLSNCKKLFVPGNHDIWVNETAKSLSWVMLSEYLPELTKQFNWTYLIDEPTQIDGTIFLGNMGWYDYEFRNKIWDDKLTLNHYRIKINPMNNLSWMDRKYVNFGDFTDQEITNMILKHLRSQIQNINFEEDKFQNIVIGSHFVPFIEFIKYRGLMKYDYFTAFLGTPKLGEVIKELPNSLRKISVFGHTHFPNILKIDNGIEGYCVPIGYPNEYGKDADLIDVFENRIGIIEIF